SSQIKEAAKSLGFSQAVVLNGLVRGGYILPVYFKGLYYLLDADEKQTKYLKRKSFEIVADICDKKFDKNWYFGLSSALYFNGISHQTPLELFIITNSHSSASFEFSGTAFKIRRSSAKDFLTEVKERGPMRFSSPLRTITDYIYFYAKEGKTKYAVETVTSILNACPQARERLRNMLMLAKIYPKPYNLAISKYLRQASGRNV
ncbi:MAG: hypothetical protein AB1468_05730, partial [Candidatus Micrarchaeota archaeon]